jgi:methyl-accepting chemotaxis protein
MSQLNSITQQTASASEELAATAEELSAQANELQNLMGFFRLQGDAAATARRTAPPPARTAPARAAAFGAAPARMARPAHARPLTPAPELDEADFGRF